MIKNLDSDPRNTIAFQGAEGTHVELACRKAYPFMSTLACSTFEQVVNAVEKNIASLGMIPIENSHMGRLAEIHKLIPDTPLYLVGEHIQKIEYVIAGTQGSKIEEIEKIYSHPLSIDACKNNLDKLELKDIENHSNIALAAANIAKWNDPRKAALTSYLAAEINDLKILKESLEDKENDNYAVFAIIAKEKPDIDDENAITSLMFNIPNNFAILSKALGGFITNNIEMLKLETFIEGTIGNKSNVYLSFIGNPKNSIVKSALKELEFFASHVEIIGVYPADKKRLND